MTEIAGDVAVGRHVVTGGNAKIQGGAIVKRNLKVEGWLDAPNIKGPAKGFFKSEEQLNAAFPLPKRGWWALVGATLPATLWIVERDEQGIDRWVSTGKTAGTPTVEASWCMEAIENLSEELDNVVKPDIAQNTSDISGIKTDISAIKAEQKTQNEEIEAIKLETGQNSLELSTLPSTLDEIRLEVRQNSTSISVLPTKQDVKAVSDRAEFGAELAGEAVEGVGTINDMRGKANGFAPLDGTGKVPARHLPGYVDDVVEFGAVVSEVEMLPITLFQSTDAGCMVVYDSDRNVFLLAVSKVAVSGEHIDKWHHEILQPAKPQYTPAAPDDTADPTSPADPAEQSEPAPLSVENEAPAVGTYWQIEGGETILLKKAFTFYGSWGDGETFGTEAEAGGRTPESGKVYSCTSSNKTYRWGARQLVVIGSDLALGHTANTAFPGDEGSGLATSVGQLNENVDRINERIHRGDNRGIKPFDGIWDGTGNAPTSGVWYCPSDVYDGKWCFKSFGETRKFYGYAEEDYNTDETAISGLYRCDKALYSVDAEGIEPHVTKKDATESIDRAKLQLFNDTWDVLVGGNGYYDPAAAPDADHPYLLNGLWLSYKEAIKIVAYANTPIDDVPYAFVQANVRTLIPPPTPGSGWSGHAVWKMTFVGSAIETLVFTSESYVTLDNTFHFCERLKTIKNPIHLNRVTSGTFTRCAALEEISIADLHTDISFADSPLLSMTSVSYMVEHATGSSAITITLHPDAYARVTNAILAAANAKQITIASA